MFRRLAAAVLSVAFLLGAAAAPALAYNPGYGNCTTAQVNEAGHFLPTTGGLDGPTQGAQAAYDATLAGHLCSNPGLALDNGWRFGTIVRDTAGVGFMFVGETLCDDSTLAPYCDWQNRSQPHFLLYRTRCAWPNTDEVFDLGEADWAQHQYRIWFDWNAQTWHYYVDGVDKGYAVSAAAGTNWYCLNPRAGHGVYAGFVDQRLDQGDGWGDTNNYVTVRNMQIRTDSGWSSVSGTTGNNCAENTRPYPNTHYQVCIYDQYAGMKMVTVY